jgi:hypothetical protein
MTQPEQNKTRNIIMGCGVVALLLLAGAGIGAFIASNIAEKQASEDLGSMLDKVRVEHEGVITVKNGQVSSLQAALAQKDVDLGLAADQIKKLHDAPEKVKYITHVVTRLEPTETKVVQMNIKNLKPEHLFSYKIPGADLVVVKMNSLDTDTDGIPDELAFTQYAQTFNLDAVLAEGSSSFLLTVTSDFDGTAHQIPVKANVTYIDKTAPENKTVHPAVSMHIGGWGGVSLSSGDPAMGYQAGFGLMWLHPTPNISLLAPEIGVGQAFYPQWQIGDVLYSSQGQNENLIKNIEVGSARAGIEIASYNLGISDASLLQDTWIGADITIGTDGSLGGGITLSTRL